MNDASKVQTKVDEKPQKRRITIERTFRAPARDVWELWTTKEGIESWWGPDGFTTKVFELDLRPKAKLHYAMTATGAEQIDFMKKNGMPLTNHTRGWYDEIVALERLLFWQIVDFVPGVAAYDIETLVELFPGAQGVRLVLTFDVMHDERWTQLAKLGWEGQLGRLDAALAQRRP
ncbi:MAG TPA: SRPBCC domain-containing protein [Polyangia bacterium]|nr:SRPBCC domain-containing protein [Polyangia bacterium]